MSVTQVSRNRPDTGPAPRRQSADYVRVRSFILDVGTASLDLEQLGPASDTLRHTVVGEAGRWRLGFVPESPEYDAASDGHGTITLLLGDDLEWNDVGDHGCMGNAVVVRVDVQRRTMEVWGSITGLPPVFLSRRAGGVALTSDLSLLPAAGQSLRFDARAVEDHLELGYPAGHRTLFADTILVPGGHVVRVDAEGGTSTARSWTLPAAPPCDWPSFIELQAESFRDAMRKMDLSRSFFSLTAGVDTRTILAALVSQGSQVPTATLCGATLSLDARAARALSRAYNLPHHAVHLGVEFCRNLPAWVSEAVRRSGGLSGVEEAGEVYFYRELAGLGARRLSGGFGNQVARQGLERVSPRGADPAILSREFSRARPHAVPASPALSGTAAWLSVCERLLQVDGTLPSVGNALIGQHFATQQTPYASRALMESLGRSPLGLEPPESFSRSGARWRDLHHRFLGEPRERSFQRAFIARVGGPVAAAPINWGWRPSGGVSVSGLFMGALACLDQVASWSNPGSRGLRKILRLVGTEGFQEIKPYRAWVTDWLKEFAHDTLLSDATRTSGLFDAAELSRVLREHYRLGKDRTGTIIAALDLALAHQLFGLDRGRRARSP